MESETRHILGDPLSEVARHERRLLLAVSLVAYAIVKTGAVPEKIELLGIDFAQADRQAFVWLLTLIVLYFLAAFLIYGVADFLTWWHSFLNMRIQNIGELHEKNRQSSLKNLDSSGVISQDIHDRFTKLSEQSAIRRFYVGKVSKPVAMFRAMFEFLLPLVFAVFVLVALAHSQGSLKTKPNKASEAIGAPGAPQPQR